MLVPITLIVGPRTNAQLARHCATPTTALIASRDLASATGTLGLAVETRLVLSEPDIYYRSPGCDCCAYREDLVDAIVRATRRATPPEHIVIAVDPHADDVPTAIATLLSSVDITRRGAFDAVIVHVDGVEAATRLATGGGAVDPSLAPAIAVADRVVIDQCDQLTSTALDELRTALHLAAGFATVTRAEDAAGTASGDLEAWHGAPAATTIVPGGPEQPETLVLDVDRPLDAEAIDEWLNMLIAQYASRLLRVQGALSVRGNDERTCIYGVRSFATSHSENDHRSRRSDHSIIAICGWGLDREELSRSFLATVAS